MTRLSILRIPIIGMLNTVALGAMARLAVKLDKRQFRTAPDMLMTGFESATRFPLDIINLTMEYVTDGNVPLGAPITSSMGSLRDRLPYFYFINVVNDTIVHLASKRYNYLINATAQSALNGISSFLMLHYSGGNFTTRQKILTSVGASAFTYGVQALMHADELEVVEDTWTEADLFSHLGSLVCSALVFPLSKTDTERQRATVIRRAMLVHMITFPLLSWAVKP
jgi:hypothetical protein